MGYRTSVSIAVLVGLVSAAAAQQTTIVIESGTVRADDLRFAVRLESTVEVNGVQNDVLLDSGIRIAVRADGRPDCRGEAVRTPSAAFAFRPQGCIPGESCVALRALILPLGAVDPIASGSLLYSCRLAADIPPGRYPLGCANAGAADPNGDRVDVACVGGEVEVESSTVLRGGDERAAAGQSGAVDVTLFSNEAVRQVSATLDFAPLLARGGSRPACRVTGATASFGYLPSGCVPGVTCTGVQASLESAAPFIHAATLFTCGVDVPLATAVGEYPVRFTAAGGTTDGGGAAAVETVNGSVRVIGPASPTPVPPTPLPGLGALEVGAASGAPGATVEIAVTLRTGQPIGGIQNDLHFAVDAPVIIAADGKPACELAADVDWFPGSTVALQPPACVPDVTCTGLRAVLLTGTAGGVIPDGTVLYTCAFAIDPAASGGIALPCSNQLGSTPQGQAVPLTCSAGRIDVVDPTPLPTSTPVSGSNPQTGGSSSGGCAVSEPAARAWWLLLPTLALLSRRRPRR